MLINQAYRYELKPNNKQKTLLAKHAGVARFAYNWGLVRRKELYEKTKGSTTAVNQHRELNKLKKSEFPWMYEVSKCAPQEALRDLHQAYQNFFRELKKGKKTGFPKFKKKDMHDSFRLTGAIGATDNTVQLPRLGKIRAKERIDLKGRILSAAISKEADRWYVSFAVERDRKIAVNNNGEAVGIDLGLENFAVLSDSSQIPNPMFYKKSLRLLRRSCKQLTRKQKSSYNRKKAIIKLSRLHRRVRNKRFDFLHKASTELAKTKSMIVVESLNVKGMVKNRCLSGAISDVGWGMFKAMLRYKASWYGSKLIEAPDFFPSSRICSNCGTYNAALELSDRVFECPGCGLRINRDLNAAVNLKKYTTASSAGSYACRDTSGGGIPIKRESTSHVSLKQEADAKSSSGIFG
ncbi:MAG: RNA-guided endonuclease TnpB family protein [Candidatus Omnitrophota bacterium]